MELNWQRVIVTNIDSTSGVQSSKEIDFGLDDTGRIFGEIRNDEPIYLALHLRKVVGRYLDLDRAKTATQLVHDIITAPLDADGNPVD